LREAVNSLTELIQNALNRKILRLYLYQLYTKEQAFSEVTPMLRLLLWLFLLVLPLRAAMAGDCPAALDFQVRPLASARAESLCEHYAGKVLLVVNTASRCGFIPFLYRFY
jgi:hypothetical protein